MGRNTYTIEVTNEKLANKIKGDRRFMQGRSHPARRRLHIGRFRFVVTEQIGFMISWGGANWSMPAMSHVAIHIPFLSIYIYETQQ